jgi:hypothetical protein
MSDLITLITERFTNLDIDIKKVTPAFLHVDGAQIKDCYNNAFKYLLNCNFDATYVLGYLIYNGGIPIEHAYVKDADQYYDVTLVPNEADSYLSVIELSFVEVSEYIITFSSAPDLYSYNNWIKTLRRKQNL